MLANSSTILLCIHYQFWDVFGYTYAQSVDNSRNWLTKCIMAFWLKLIIFWHFEMYIPLYTYQYLLSIIEFIIQSVLQYQIKWLESEMISQSLSCFCCIALSFLLNCVPSFFGPGRCSHWLPVKLGQCNYACLHGLTTFSGYRSILPAPSGTC